jgi:hypothetical protein
MIKKGDKKEKKRKKEKAPLRKKYKPANLSEV